MKAGSNGQAAEPPQRLAQATRLEGAPLLAELGLELQELWEV